jgi:hypothetical protein
MKTTRFVLPAAISFVVILVPLSGDCHAGGYRSGATAYRAPGSGTVYGFGSNGQSFVYRQSSGSGNYGQSPQRISGYGNQYRMDGFTAPRSNRSARPAPASQPAFFSGRVWYPRGY